MDEEITPFYKNQTQELIQKPPNKKEVSCKWIYRVKEGIPGVKPQSFKARLVAKGFTHKQGIDFTKVFSLVVRYSFLRIFLALVAINDLHLEQIDVKLLSYMVSWMK